MNRTLSNPGTDCSAPWTEPFVVRTYETDPLGRLSILSLCQYLQEAAAHHAEALGVGLAELNRRHLTWVLSRFRVSVRRLAAAGDPITVVTWPSGMDRLFALRDFIAADRNGARVAAADSAWLVIDTKKRRPVRLDPMVEKLRPRQDPPVLQGPMEKLPAAGTDRGARRFQVRYRDLDGNGHVNNGSYIEWIVESFAPDFLAQSTLVRLEVEFLAEALAGESVRCTCRPSDAVAKAFLHGVFRESDHRELARARTVWRKSG